MDLQEFMKLEPPGHRPNMGSKLDAFAADIRELVRTGRTRAQIQRYLKAQDLKTSIQTITAWLRKHNLRTQNEEVVAAANARRAATKAAKAAGNVGE